jgi:GT2 family glycosyltransferase
LNKRICCIVVTYNRLQLLKECIKALLNQTVVLNKIYIIDNCSSDGTEQYLKNLVKSHSVISYQKLDRNIGGAGGFNFGLKVAYKEGMDYFWMMDDDTIPEGNALEKLLNDNSIDKIGEWGFLCSNVLWKDNTPCLMNVPATRKVWNKYAHFGYIELEGTSFVSVLISKDAIRKVGFPIKEFFIWGDDVEFTMRLSKNYAPGYMVVKSIVIHKMNENRGINLVLESDKGRIARQYYGFRNKVYLARTGGLLNKVQCISYIILTIGKTIFGKTKYKFLKVCYVLKGCISGLFFNPSIEYPEV